MLMPPNRSSAIAGEARTPCLTPIAAATRGALLCVALGLVVPAAALAQPDPAKPAAVQTLATVSVIAGPEESAWGPVNGYRAKRSATASKTDTPIIETPQSVTVVTRELLDDQQVQDIAEAMRYVAGASGGEDGRDGFSSIRLRGFAQSSFTMRDGTRQNPFGIIPQDPYGLERIDIMKGPSSVLFGQAGPGGVVNLVSKRPSSTPSREVGIGVGQFGYRQLLGDMTGPLNQSGELSYRLVARVLDRKDEVDFVGEERIYVAPAITWRPSARTSLTALADYVNVDAVRINTLPVQGTLLPNPNGSIPFSRFIGEPDFDRDDKRQWQAGYLFEHVLDDHWTLRQNLRFTNYEAETRTTFTLGIQNNLRLLNRRPVLRNYDGTVLTLDNQAEAKWLSGKWEHTALAGLDYLRHREDQVRFNGSMAPLDLITPSYGSPTKFDSQAAIDSEQQLKQAGVYAQHQAKFDNRWVFLLGGRYDKADRASDNNIKRSSTLQDDTAFTGRAGLVYLFKNGFAPYASFSQSFDPISGTDASGSPFEPETGEQAEVGLKYESPDQRWGATLSVYDLRRKNVPTADPDDDSNRIQVGEQTHQGVDLELAGELTPRLKVVAALSYLDAKITRDNTLDAKGNKRLEGKTPLRIPERSASIWAKYRMPETLLPGLSLAAGARYAGGIERDPDNTSQVPSYVVWDAGLYLERPKTTFSLNVKNLFDRKYFAAGTNNTNVVVGDPLTLVANITYRW